MWDPAVHSLPYMFPVPDRWMPGHQLFQFLVSRGLAQVRQHGQYQQQVFVGFNAVSLCRFHQGIHNGTGLCSLDTITEQPVLPAYHKGSDGILCQMNIPAFESTQSGR